MADAPGTDVAVVDPATGAMPTLTTGERAAHILHRSARRTRRSGVPPPLPHEERGASPRGSCGCAPRAWGSRRQGQAACANRTRVLCAQPQPQAAAAAAAAVRGGC